MEANPILNPNKRKQPSSSSSAPFLGNNHTHHSISRLKINEGREEPSGFSVLVKLLRARRIFSPNPKQIHHQADELFAATKKVGSNHCSPDVGENKINEEMGKLDPIETRVQTTPPEAVELFDRSGHGLSHNADRGSTKLSNISRTGQSISKSRSGLSKCVRGRLFKPPSSVSYRRLLPYLMDIDKEDDSGLIGTCQSQKPKRCMEEKMLQQVPDSSQDRCLVSALSPAVEAEIPGDPTKDLCPCSVISPVPMIEDLSEMRTSCEDSNIIGYASINQILVKQDLEKCTDCGVREFSDYAKTVEKGDADEGIITSSSNFGTLSERRGMDDVGKVIPMDTEEYDKAFLRERSCPSSCDDSPNRSNLRASAAEGNAVCLISEKASGPTGKSSNGAIDEIKGSSAEDGEKSPAKSKMVLKPCMRSKLLQSPNSFSYRRLLPYLMEIEKDDYSGTVGKDQSHKHVDCSKENLHPAPESLDCPKPSSDVPNEHFPTPKKFPLPCSLQKDRDGNDLITKVSEVSSDVPNEHSPTPKKFPLPCSLQKDRDGNDLITKVSEVSSDVPNEHSPTAKKFPLPCSLQKDGDGNDLITKVSEVESESSPGKGKVIDELNPVMNEGDGLLLEDSTQCGASNHIGIPLMESRRGILKRNPRGCRGLCPCLNCASFRLNAEHSFEFSRNQMKDAEELALDLMKEMSFMRNLLQRINASAIAPDNQVLEACRRASEAEDIAKDRLSQMNEDLNIHCRVRCLHRPRVTINKLCAEDPPT